MKDYSYTYNELMDEMLWYKAQLSLALNENKVLRKQAHDATEQMFQGCLTSDRMKLDLILSGCLVKPAIDPIDNG